MGPWVGCAVVLVWIGVLCLYVKTRAAPVHASLLYVDNPTSASGHFEGEMTLGAGGTINYVQWSALPWVAPLATRRARTSRPVKKKKCEGRIGEDASVIITNGRHPQRAERSRYPQRAERKGDARPAQHIHS